MCDSIMCQQVQLEGPLREGQSTTERPAKRGATGGLAVVLVRGGCQRFFILIILGRDSFSSTRGPKRWSVKTTMRSLRYPLRTLPGPTLGCPARECRTGFQGIQRRCLKALLRGGIIVVSFMMVSTECLLKIT